MLQTVKQKLLENYSDIRLYMEFKRKKYLYNDFNHFKEIVQFESDMEDWYKVPVAVFDSNAIGFVAVPRWNPKVKEWLDIHAVDEFKIGGPAEVCHFNNTVYFKNPDDAMRFKLRWV